jgi:hypothetical protein
MQSCSSSGNVSLKNIVMRTMFTKVLGNAMEELNQKKSAQ